MVLRMSLIKNDLKNVKIAEKSLKIGQFGQFYPILATFYEFKSRFEKSWLTELRRPILNLIFPESTCSGASKISNDIFFHGIWVKLFLSLMCIYRALYINM
jgi:hypothetical protein